MQRPAFGERNTTPVRRRIGLTPAIGSVAGAGLRSKGKERVHWFQHASEAPLLSGVFEGSC
jgi:hypothetical protein